MRQLIAALLALGGVAFAAAEEPASLAELVKQAREERMLESKALVAREQEFRKARDQQLVLIEKLRAELSGERRLGERLKARYEENALFLNTQTAILQEKTGSLGELFGVARQVAKDTHSLLTTSLVSAQKPKRDGVPARLADRKDNPSIDELEQLWLVMLDEMQESGAIARFRTAVTLPDGTQRDQEVVRLGTFNLLSGGHYLHYLPETGRIVELGRQPAGRFLELAADYERAKSGLLPVALDPSRGAILNLMVESPSMTEHIARAGSIGYVILALGGLALLIVIERTIALAATRRKVENARRNGAAASDNPLGRLRQVAEQNPRLDAEGLAFKLDQAMLGEAPRFKRSLPTLAVFATAAPLLGLLGTVAGMIDTFQSMALFGAGDPKLVSAGISLALVATELGLLVAIPVLLLHSWLSSKSNRLLQMLEEDLAGIVAEREAKAHAVHL